MNSANAQWATVASLLRQAGDIVGGESTLAVDVGTLHAGPLVGSWKEFQTFLRHDEFELAWECVERMATARRSASDVWLLLAKASQAMGLKGHTKQTLKELERPLTIAVPADRRLVYQVRQPTALGKGRWVTRHVGDRPAGIVSV